MLIDEKIKRMEKIDSLVYFCIAFVSQGFGSGRGLQGWLL